MLLVMKGQELEERTSDAGWWLWENLTSLDQKPDSQCIISPGGNALILSPAN